jgi:hypothetical protein
MALRFVYLVTSRDKVTIDTVFGKVTGFIEHLQIVTTDNYSAIAH